jgi:NitT/TauT family transport system ATP-binding protein
MALMDSAADRAKSSDPSGASTTRVVEIERLSLVFETADGPVHALSDFDLIIGAGEFVSFE